MLSKRERNQLYETIVAEGLDPAEFSLEDKFFRVLITHNSGSTFKFSPSVGSSRAGSRFQVTVHVADGIDQTVMETNVEDMTRYSFLHWLMEIRATAGAPDYWEEMQRSQESVALMRNEGFGNTPFTEDEQRQIAAQFLEIQIKVNQFQLPREQMSQVEEGLDELEEASHRLGRKDWLIMLMTTLSPVVISDILTPGLSRHVFTMAINDLVHLFTGEGEPPQIPA
jgi:hypothetical protein